MATRRVTQPPTPREPGEKFSAGLCLLVRIVVALMLAHGTASAAIIDLKNQVRMAPGGLVVLADIARIHDAEPAEVERLGRITLAPKPEEGRRVALSFEEIRMRLSVQGVNLATIDFRGAQQVQIEILSSPALVPPTVGPAPASGPAPVRQVSVVRQAPPARWEHAKADEIATTAFRRVFRTSELEQSGMKLEVRVVDDDVRQLLLTTAESLHFDDSHFEPGPSRPVTAWWMTEAGERKSIRTVVGLERVAVGLKVRQSLPAGSVLTAQDLIWAENPSGDPAVIRLADALGKQTKRMLRAGEMLKPDDLEGVEVIRQRDIVTVCVQRPGIVVRRPYQALSSGRVNDVITLAALDDPRVRVQAVVTGPYEAVIPAGGVVAIGQPTASGAFPGQPNSGGPR